MSNSSEIRTSLFGIPDISQLKKLSTTTLETRAKNILRTAGDRMVQGAGEGGRSYLLETTYMHSDLQKYVADCFRDAGYAVSIEGSVSRPALRISW